MLLTKNIVKFSGFLVKIPDAMKGVWDSSDNRWEYRKIYND